MDKRIVIFTGMLRQGGAERVISILSRHMAEAGYKVALILYHDAEIFYEIHPQIRATCVESESGTKNKLRNALWIRRYFHENADIVISFLAPFNILALAAHMGLRSKIIVADRNDPRFVPGSRMARLLRNVLYRFADGVVLQTDRNKAYFGRQIQRKSAVIFNPVDLGGKAGLALKTPKQKKIVSVGRLMPQKNQKMLLEAFAKISKEYPEHALYIYGEGPEHDHLRRYADSLGIGARVRLPGSVPNVFDLIADAELFVLCSSYEGMPNALIEAMCLGLPCITTRVSGAEELVAAGLNGEIVDTGDAGALAKAMKKLLGNEALRRKYAQKATLMNDRLVPHKIMQEWLDFLERSGCFQCQQ